jgi:nicotinate-nucleotide--dimethylbenzimidazole phosphoribosyltransferase
MSPSPPASDIAEAARAAIYDVIAKRRDVRLFRPGVPVPDDALVRMLYAAHLAPSVGFSQPWDFVVVRDLARRQRIRENFLRCRHIEAARFAPERREKYLAYRLEGIVESALNLCVTVDLRPAEEAILGTTAQPEALRWSACCAVQNLWLAARAEGIGVGWVSIVEPAILRAELELPPGIEPVAYLCVGVPVEFLARPMLEETGWRPRKALCDAIHDETYRGGSAVRRAPARSSAEAAGSEIVPEPPPFDTGAASAARAHQAKLTKPVGSLGRLEELAIWYAGAVGQFPVLPPARSELFVFAADHGVVAEGVSPYSSAVTAAMVQNFLAGGAAVNALARSCGVDLTVVDVGVAGDLTSLPTPPQARFVSAKVRAGTRNFQREPALTRAEVDRALGVGVRMAQEAKERGTALLLAGEMGIGNTTAAAALLSALTGLAPKETVGRGTGVDDQGLAHKAKVVSDALARHAPLPRDPYAVLCAVGGLEICAMAGLMLGGAASRVPVVVDGFISGVAALLAIGLRPAVKDYLCLAHLSAERGQGALCRALGLSPVLDLGMRLGEGTGAILAAHLVSTAVRAQAEMATFATAGIPDRSRVR